MSFKLAEEIKITFQQIVDFLNKILGEIFGFIAEEEGWVNVEEEVTE